MAVMERLREERALKADQEKFKPPPDVEDRVKRSRVRMRQGAAKRNESWEFYRGNHFAYLNDRGTLSFNTAGDASVRGPGKPQHRMRTKRNLIKDIVLQEVSAATQRVPSYTVAPSTTDQEDIAAAALSERVAIYGHDKWNVRLATEKVVTSAVVAQEGFAWPFFDNTVGPYIADPETGQLVGEGEIAIRTFTGNEVSWEPGVRFEDSPYHCIEQARVPEQVYQMPGYLGGPLKEDADVDHLSGRGQNQASNTKMVVVTDYLERPNPKHPNGRWVTVANGRRIVPDRNYPCAEYGYDGPVLLKLCYAIDPDSDRDLGLVEDLIDPMRTINDSVNRLLEWKNLALMPQMIVPPGLPNKVRITDEPGVVYEVPQPDQIKWREVPPIPRELFDLVTQEREFMSRMAAQTDPPGRAESGQAVQAWFERDQARRAAFLNQLAEFYSRLMRQCLLLVQKHYTEPRLMKIKGRAGWETEEFLGADLRSQVDIRVFPDSIEPQTKQAVTQKVLAYADRGWIDPGTAMHAVESGTAGSLIQDVKDDVGRASRIINRLRQGPEALFSMPEQVGPDGQMIPGWMPRRFDNIPVQKTVWEQFFKSEEWERLDPGMQEAGNLVYQSLLQIEAEKAAEEAMIQTMMAEQQGMQNAAAPQGAKATPDSTAVGDSGLATKNQPADQAIPS